MIFSGSSESARKVLSAIASAMIGVAGTVFSITLVVLTLATNQFGPRLLRNFMYQNMNQIVLGSYSGTYLYCLIVLNAVKGQETYTFVPNLSVLFALVLAVINIVLLILFIHHVSISIQSSNVIENIGDIFNKSSNKIYPSGFGGDLNKENVKRNDFNTANTIEILNKKDGYLQFIDNELMDFAKKEHVVVEVFYRPGHYILKNLPIAYVHNYKSDDNSQLKKNLSNYFHLDTINTNFQNPEFAIHQLVEVACRALSSGINDPFTAINCLDKLTGILGKLSQTDFPSPYRCDEDGELRLILEPLDFEGMTDAAFNQIRQFGASSPSVIIHLMKCLKILYTISANDGNKRTIVIHSQKTMETAESSFVNKQDLSDLTFVYNSIR